VMKLTKSERMEQQTTQAREVEALRYLVSNYS